MDRDQEFLLPPSMIDWLGEDHLVWFVIEAVKRLDTAVFHRLARLGGVGRRGYDPDMVLTLFVYAMAHGQSSSRRIERLCQTDVAFRIICAQDAPDHTVLARFRQNHQDALADLLTESLVLAAELGMVSLGTVALDGTKIAASASRDANRSEAYLRTLAERYLDTLAETDQAEDALFGQDHRGEEPAPGGGDRTGRRVRIDRALEQIKVRREQAEKTGREQAEKLAERERALAQGRGTPGPYPKSADRVEIARIRWQRERAAATERWQRWQQERERGEPRGRGRAVVPPDEHYLVRHSWAAYQTAAAASEGTDEPGSCDATRGDHGERFTANLTDPDSRLLKTRNGWVQGYNCQTATSEDGFLLYAHATQDANDVEQFVPTMNAVTTTAEDLATRVGRADLAVGTLLADAGYDSAANLAADGPDRLIADGKRHTLARRAATDPANGDPPEHASDRQKMNHRLRTADGHAHYKRRSHLIEAPNAWLKDGRGLRRFARRGLDAARAELAFASAVTNLLKISTKGVTASQLHTG